jgi:hypothetical protein
MFRQPLNTRCDRVDRRVRDVDESGAGGGVATAGEGPGMEQQAQIRKWTVTRGDAHSAQNRPAVAVAGKDNDAIPSLERERPCGVVPLRPD